MKTVDPSARSTGLSARFIPDESPAPDREFLDDLLDQFVQALEDGRPIDAQPGLDRRPDLREQIAAVMQRAEEIAAVPVVSLPAVPGYVLIRRLGAGGMGAVYLARQERVAGRSIALKILPAGAALSPRARERFRAEAAAIARLRHPHIVNIHDVVDQGSVHAFVMEWVDGVSLADAIAQAAAATESSRQKSGSAAQLSLDAGASNPFALAPAGVAQIGIAIGRALAAVHAAGLLHRDVKPSNILVRRDGTPLLSDFGLVRDTDATITSPGHFAGTLAYAPPEQLRGEIDRLDARSDVYALGATLYHTLTRRLPFRGQTPTELLKQIESGRVFAPRKLNPRIPADLQTIIFKAMEAEPSRRYQAAADLADDLQRLLNLQPIHAKPIGLVTRTFKLVRRNRAALTGAALGGLLAAGALMAAIFWLFWVPRWSAEHIRKARLALLEPDAANHIAALVLGVFEGVPGEADKFRLFQRLDGALLEYAAAARWSPLPEALAREAAVVRAVRLDQPCPALDPRSRGLHAFLNDNQQQALVSWTHWEKSRDTLSDPDPLVDTALGILRLFDNQPARAYPRLQKAVEIFPQTGFLFEYLAEAAAKSGDVIRARRYLDASRRLPQRDPWGASARIEAVLLAAEGNLPGALTALQNCSRGPLIQIERARILARARRREPALLEYQSLLTAAHLSPSLLHEFRSCASEWWSSLDSTERRSAIQAALHQQPDQPGSLVNVLRIYRNVAAPHARPSMRLSEMPESGFSMPAGFSAFLLAGAAIRDLISSPSLQSLSIPELAKRMEVENMPLWNRLNRLSNTEKSLVIASWRIPAMRSFAHGWLALRTGVALGAALLTHNAYAQCDSAPCFQGLGDLPGGEFMSRTSGNGALAADGSTVVGSSKSVNGIEAFRWTAATGMLGLGDGAGGEFLSRAFSVSADGAFVTGETDTGDSTCGGHEAFRWSQNDGLGLLGDAPGGCFWSIGAAISADGSRICGESYSATGQYQASYWAVSTGWTPMAPPPSSFNACNADGTIMAGTYGNAVIYYSPETDLLYLDDLPGGSVDGYAYGLSADGSILVGRGATDLGQQGFRWTLASGMVPLADLPGGNTTGVALGISADGSLIVGEGATELGMEAALWNPDLEVARVADVLTLHGVNIPAGWLLTSASAIRTNPGVVTICGTGTNPSGNTEAWIARYTIPRPPCLGDLDGDRDIDLSDLAIALGNYGCTTNCVADLDGDGDMDLGDLSTLLSRYGVVCP